MRDNAIISLEYTEEDYTSFDVSSKPSSVLKAPQIPEVTELSTKSKEQQLDTNIICKPNYFTRLPSSTPLSSRIALVCNNTIQPTSVEVDNLPFDLKRLYLRRLADNETASYK